MAYVQNKSLSFMGDPSYAGEKLIYPAATRNQGPILQVLKDILPITPNSENFYILLEISSGSGQHLAHFAPHFPHITFQPSEFDRGLFGSIQYYVNQCVTKNILNPIYIDIANSLTSYGFELESLDYVYNSNLIHISPYKCTIGLFDNAGKFLKKSGIMITYGPYSVGGVITPESNVAFDASLRERDSSWGLRDVNDLQELGKKNNLILIDTKEMPANNKILVWKKI